MKPRPASPTLLVIVLLGLAAGPARAAGVASDSRDASAAFVATQNFIVGRIGRDCLETLGREETPAAYQAAWQKRNASYYDAATAYMAARLAEIEDEAERDAVESAYYASVNNTGERAAAQILEKGERTDVCRHALTMVDAGQMDIDTFVVATRQATMAARLNELVKWAAQR